MNTEDRFINIEIKVAQQEDLVESLSQRIYEQQQQIDKLEQLCAVLVQRLRDNSHSGSSSQLPHERPPHY